MSKKGKVDRRQSLKMGSVAGAAGTMPIAEVAAHAKETLVGGGAHVHNHPSPPNPRKAQRTTYEFFDTNESAFVEAAVDTLIPADALGPGAKELGVATYIDRQMAGAYGTSDRIYLEGPFAESTPQQGLQLAMTPSEVIRIGIADINAYVQKNYESSFEALSLEDRIAVLTDTDAVKIELPTVPIATFFGLLLQLTVEAYFADSIYGCDKDKAAWTMIGFPGANAVYLDKIARFRGSPYATAPMSIQDLIPSTETERMKHGYGAMSRSNSGARPVHSHPTPLGRPPLDGRTHFGRGDVT